MSEMKHQLIVCFELYECRIRLGFTCPLLACNPYFKNKIIEISTLSEWERIFSRWRNYIGIRENVSVSIWKR